MDNKTIKDKAKANFAVIVAQAVFCILVLAIIVAIKLIGGEVSYKFTQWYNTNVKDVTDVSEVVDEDTLFIKSDKLTILSASQQKNDAYLITPLSGQISSYFGYRTDPINGEYKMHNGLDIAAEKGSEIVSAYDGVVFKTGYDLGYGNFIIIDHSGGLKTLYGHCDSITAKTGQTVQQGQAISTVGSTGRSTGNHLHFEIIKDGSKVDPLWIIG